MENDQITIEAETLRQWLDTEKPVFILDVRPNEQREEWQIPGSFHLDAYQRLNSGDSTVLDEVKIPAHTKVVTVCAAGKTSLKAAKGLRERGYKAYSLEGGMKRWSLSWNTATHIAQDLKIIQIRRTGKGCLSYLILSKNEGVVIDASVDPEIYIRLAEENDSKITHVLDSHIHADHLSRSPALAAMAGATLYMPDQNKVKFEFKSIKNGEVIPFGSSRLKAISTPGHTIESTSFLLNEKYLFSGDTLFKDGVGRPDLKADKEEAAKRAGLLYHSLGNLLDLDDEVLVLPGHISKPVAFDKKLIGSTIKDLKSKILSLQLPEEAFVEYMLAHIPPTPANYLRIVEYNLEGNLLGIDAEEIEAGANRCAVP